MNCLKCLGKLQKKHIEGIEVECCYICEGIWFDTGELERVIKLDSQDFDFDQVGHGEFDGKECVEFKKEYDSKPAACPKCNNGTLLINKEYHGKSVVHADCCPHGHGIWLDGGEIQYLRQRWVVDFKKRLMDLFLYFKYGRPKGKS